MLSTSHIDRVVDAALDEDAPWGDLTSEAFLPEGSRATAELVAREPGILAGSAVFEAAFRLTDVTTTVSFHLADGDRFDTGTRLATVSGPAHAVLRAERIGLNFCQRLCGIATATRSYVDRTTGTHARVVDTRKTTPGLRALERHAVRCGGGHNHRFSLSDAVMAKDNHLAVLAARGISVSQAIRRARERLPHTTRIEVEVDRPDQIADVLAGGADIIMLDNFTPEQLRRGVEEIAGRAVVEASGNITLDTVAEVAATGVDVISSGALTHSARALDLGLDVAVHDDQPVREEA